MSNDCPFRLADDGIRYLDGKSERRIHQCMRSLLAEEHLVINEVSYEALSSFVHMGKWRPLEMYEECGHRQLDN